MSVDPRSSDLTWVATSLASVFGQLSIECKLLGFVMFCYSHLLGGTFSYLRTLFQVGSKVEYYSVQNGKHIKALVTEVAPNGDIKIGQKPDAFITVAEQVEKNRLPGQPDS